MTEEPLLQLSPESGAPFPDTCLALRAPNGLLAWGGDLEPVRLLNAYRYGIFPWYLEGQPILWWSPAPRCVLLATDVHLSRRTRRRYNQGEFRLTADTAFEQVMLNCASRGQKPALPPTQNFSENSHGREQDESGSFEASDPGTWITEDMVRAYCRLHDLGRAHSVEVWRNEELVGGVYGLAIGKVFFGESMFSRSTDASKIALVALCRQLVRWSFTLMDCQVANPHLFSMGAVEIPRGEFEDILITDANLAPVPAGETSWTEGFKVEPRW